MIPVEASKAFGAKLGMLGGVMALTALGTVLAPAQAQAQAAQRSRLGSDPRAQGIRAVIPLDEDKVSKSTDFVPEFHGFFRAPLQLSIGSRDNPQDGQGSTTFHTPALTPDTQFGSWLLSNNAPGTWGAWTFTYGNKYASGTIGIGAYNFAATQSSGATAPETIEAQDSVIFGPVFVTLSNPDLNDGKLRLDLSVGSFMNRYGLAGRWDWGRYLMFGIAGTAKVGYTGGIEFDATEDVTVRFEQGFGGNNFPNLTGETGPVGTTLLVHGSGIVGYKETLKASIHGFHAFTSDDRVNPSDTTGVPDGSQTILGADVRFNGEGFAPGAYVAVNWVNNENVANVAPLLQTVNVNGGVGMIDNFLGRDSNGNGQVINVSGQIDYDLANAFWYPDPWDRASPSIELALFWLYTSVAADSLPIRENPWDGVQKFKFGAEAMYMIAPWVSAGFRYDHTMPNLEDSEQTFLSISPKVWLKSNWFTNEKIIIQYSRYIYGDKQPLAPEVFNNVTNRNNLPTSGASLPYDENLLFIAAEMYW